MTKKMKVLKFEQKEKQSVELIWNILKIVQSDQIYDVSKSEN